VVRKSRSGGAVVIIDDMMQVNVEYIEWLWCFHLWRVRNRDKLWNEGLECARRQMIPSYDMLQAFKNTSMMFLGP